MNSGELPEDIVEEARVGETVEPLVDDDDLVELDLGLLRSSRPQPRNPPRDRIVSVAVTWKSPSP